jgi:hypothetical protein
LTADDNPTTEELKAVQVEKAHAEEQAARDAADEPEERTHTRRADRAAYLAEKLAEQERADAGAEGGR